MMEKPKKIALFHPWIKSKGGAERVVLEVLRDKRYTVDVYTWVYDKENTFKEFKDFNIKVIAPKIAEKISRFYLLRGLFLPISLFSKIPLEKYDLFLISTSGVGELITFRNYKPGRTFAYVHTILRASYEDDVRWNLKNRYKKNLIKKIIYLMEVGIYRVFEKIAWRKIDVAIFNSELSLERAKKHKLLSNKKTFIVYPPINIEKLSKIKTKRGDYFLYISRFNPLKRQDVIIEAWKTFVKESPKYKIILAGGREDEKYFEKLQAGAKKVPNVEIKQNLSNDEIRKLYANCLAVIFVPFMEDFGIVPFEALAAGKSLIAVDRGGYMELIKRYPQVIQIKEEGDKNKMVDGIYKALKEFLGSKINPKKINFANLSEENFREKLFKILDNKNEK